MLVSGRPANQLGSATANPPAAFGTVGIWNAILGTLAMVGPGERAERRPASSPPVSCAGRPRVCWRAVRFAAKVSPLPQCWLACSRMPSSHSRPADFRRRQVAPALAVLMLPTRSRPPKRRSDGAGPMKEAAVGMGVTETQLLLKIVRPTAMPGFTGVMLAAARAAGETAPRRSPPCSAVIRRPMVDTQSDAADGAASSADHNFPLPFANQQGRAVRAGHHRARSTSPPVLHGTGTGRPRRYPRRPSRPTPDRPSRMSRARSRRS